ncbi:LytTR family DNA-binding domain-containing protein [Parabacteroides pacaensis]|uniref:LytTR family DNA-binding domain-containing protein n=1 Tax=Parabacteroides pacaensis TaxID=2086575 RepID=UPI000D10953D|nr:LytTR family DNA-binding domain-containing protein [Parabacteroides pacaensis]
MKSKILFYDQKIEITLKTGFVSRYYDELIYVVYENLFCYLYFSDNKKLKADITLKNMMKNLPETVFVKCNRNTILNLCYCREYDKTINKIIMEDGEVFTLSRRNITDFNTKRKNLYHLSGCINFNRCKKSNCNNKFVFCKRGNMQESNEYLE